MELKVIDEKKNRLLIETKGLGNTFCNALKNELWNDKHVKVASYRIKHPLIGIPEILVETDGSESPKNALIGATQRLKKISEKFKKDFIKEVR